MLSPNTISPLTRKSQCSTFFGGIATRIVPKSSQQQEPLGITAEAWNEGGYHCPMISDQSRPVATTDDNDFTLTIDEAL